MAAHLQLTKSLTTVKVHLHHQAVVEVELGLLSRGHLLSPRLRAALVVGSLIHRKDHPRVSVEGACLGQCQTSVKMQYWCVGESRQQQMCNLGLSHVGDIDHVAVCKENYQVLVLPCMTLLSFNLNGTALCASNKDYNARPEVSAWDTTRSTRRSEPSTSFLQSVSQMLFKQTNK